MDGRYVILPHGEHISGGRYKWINWPAEPVPLPSDVLEALRSAEEHQMDDQVSWLLEMTVKPGELDNLKALIKEMVESTRAEPGALNYQWCISDDNTTVHNFDRYSDSAAAKTHLDGFLANYAGRYMAAVDTTRLSVYGAPSDEVKEILNGFGGVYYGLIEGFTR